MSPPPAGQAARQKQRNEILLGVTRSLCPEYEAAER